MQMIFQDPISSLNPRRKVARHRRRAARHLEARHRAQSAASVVDEVLEAVGIDPQRAAESRPHQFSGGQCQRISIARALVLDPKLIICDEPVSALDVACRRRCSTCSRTSRRSYGLTLIFIAHDLAVVKNISDRVAVMYLGKLCEVAAERRRCTPSPAHPYTNVLLDVDPGRPIPTSPIDSSRPSSGELPSPVLPAVGLPVPHPLPARRRRCAHRRSRSCAAIGATATSSPATTRSPVAEPSDPFAAMAPSA